MSSYIWMENFKRQNRLKTILLIVLFPVFLFLFVWIIISIFCMDWYFWADKWSMGFDEACWICSILFIILVIWWLISFLCQKDIMFNLSWAKELQRKENPELYNIVENLCISKWLPMPKIAIMDEPGMNAFATGWKPKDSWIAFTSWLVQNLNKSEIEAVAWHELTHIMNKDSLLMYVAVVFIWSISVLWEVLLRARSTSLSSNDSGKARLIVVLFWLACLLLGYLFYPLIKLAMSRKREYLADLWSVQLTRDNQAMISALQKISWNSSVVKSNDKISSFFIANPKWNFSDFLEDANLWNYAINTQKKDKTSIWDSHPSISDRINKLSGYMF